MKKIFKIALLLCVFISVSPLGFAACKTGFACSIKDLETARIQQNAEAMQKIQKYFSKEINADLFFKKTNPQLSYNDLFIFNIIV